MKKSYITSLPLPDLPLWENVQERGVPLSFDLEITARCNLDCRHCYINLPAGDRKARQRELSFQEISDIADQAVALGCLWCLITGGEPLLRPDFPEIYLLLRKKGLLVSVFTNATLVTKEHTSLFRKHPPRDIEVSVYGVSRETFERVTRQKGSFQAFQKGVDRLVESGLKIRFKAMAMNSNLRELPEIARYCRERTADYFRFDPFLHARYDGNARRNEEIRSERLSPEAIVDLECSDPERFQSLKAQCRSLILEDAGYGDCRHLFHCGAGRGGFTIGYDGLFRLCHSLCHPACVYDLRKGSLEEAWRRFVPAVLNLRSEKKEFLEKCRACSLINLCMWCPANAHLETGALDTPVDYFCAVAHARAAALKIVIDK